MIETCAIASLCGVPPGPIIYGDALERELWARVVNRAADLKVQMVKAQAGQALR